MILGKEGKKKKENLHVVNKQLFCFPHGIQYNRFPFLTCHKQNINNCNTAKDITSKEKK
jgi:hypothetical protein